MKGKAVITGAGGFIGGHLVQFLKNQGFSDIRAVDQKPLDDWYQLHGNVENLVMDVQGIDACQFVCRDAEVVYNLAADMGGMGFIEETGAAQYYRDARILTIYEGTTAIQANDLIGRKTARDGGQTALAIAAQVAGTEAALAASGTGMALAVARRLQAARAAFTDVVNFVAGNTKASPNAVFSGSVPYLMLAGNVVAGWQMARSLLIAQQELAKGVDVDFMKAKITTARFYADHLLTKAPGMRDSIVEGADCVTALALEAF